MDKKHQTFLQVFEKLGTPLIAAVNEVAARTGGASTEKEDAEKLAQLLTSVTKASIELSEKTDLTQSDADKDDLRLGLTSVVTPLIASLYQMSGKMPAGADAQRFSEAFQALASYVDNFVSIKDAANRIKQMEDGQFFADENQIRLQTLNTLVPIVNSVVAFPFGEQPGKLIRKVTDRLLSDARDIQGEVLPDLPKGEKEHAQLSLLKGMVIVYAQSHFAEMARIVSSQDQQKREGSGLSMDPVWQAYDARIDMLKVLAAGLSDQDLGAPQAATAQQQEAPQAPQQEQATPTPQAPAQKAQPEPQPQQQEAPAQPAQTDNGGGNAGASSGSPMSFFAKKKPDDNKEGDAA